MLQEIPSSPFLHITCLVVSRMKQAFKKIGSQSLFCQYFDLKTVKWHMSKFILSAKCNGKVRVTARKQIIQTSVNTLIKISKLL
jgi:hypothetical protein